jgi:dolichyl-diphosphooligosaccharide--protein glycosyltransferase
MAWWDYGYQITAIANRTTIADGNTWNHEHIALLGRALTSAEKEGHRIARHLADYILVWAGGGGDDVAKSPHLARIANSVYRNMCPGDPVCSKFGYTKEGRPSKMMRESMLFKLHSHGLQPGVVADPNRFREVFSSKFGKCRVFKILSVSKESKDWVADPANRKCDAPGSWYCPGQYPPSMQKILKEKRDFSQLEDFNKREKDNEYQKQYFANLERKKSGQLVDEEAAPKKKAWKPNVELSQAQIDEINKVWEDNPTTSMMWEIISNGHVKELIEMLTDYPELAHSRSADGRGPMFWAMEYGNEKIIRVLKKVGVSTTVKDAKGLTPLDLKKKTNEL